MSKAQENAEIKEAIEKAIDALENCQDYEMENVLSRWRQRWWEPMGDGGEAVQGLKLILERMEGREN